MSKTKVINDLKLLKGTWEEVRTRLPEIILFYDAEVIAAEGRLTIRGKTGAEALKDQTAWPVYYGIKRAEIEKLLKFMYAQVESCRGKLCKKYNAADSRALGERMMDKYINNEDEYLSFYELYLEIDELKQKYDAICDAWDKRGFALRDWTQLKIAEMNDAII